MKANNTTTASLKGMAKYTYNRVISAMAEDESPYLSAAFTVLPEGAKSIALQSGHFSNLYIRGERKGMEAEEAARELTERASAGVSRKLRKIDKVCAVAFLTEYINRQRKQAEQPEPTNSDNTPTTVNTSEINARRFFINGKEVTANRYAAMERLNAYICRKQAEAFSRGDMGNIVTSVAWFTYEAAANAKDDIARYIENCRRFGYLKEETATRTTPQT